MLPGIMPAGLAPMGEAVSTYAAVTTTRINARDRFSSADWYSSRPKRLILTSSQLAGMRVHSDLVGSLVIENLGHIYGIGGAGGVGSSNPFTTMNGGAGSVGGNALLIEAACTIINHPGASINGAGGGGGAGGYGGPRIAGGGWSGGLPGTPGGTGADWRSRTTGVAGEAGLAGTGNGGASGNGGTLGNSGSNGSNGTAGSAGAGGNGGAAGLAGYSIFVTDVSPSLVTLINNGTLRGRLIAGLS